MPPWSSPGSFILFFLDFSQPLLVCAQHHLNSSSYWIIYSILFISYFAEMLTVFLLVLFCATCWYTHRLSTAVQFQSDCVCALLCMSSVYICMHLWLCGLLPTTHGGSRQLNTDSNNHSVCLWNSNVSRKGWDLKLWNNVKAQCVYSAGEMSSTDAEWRQTQLLVHCVQLTWDSMWPWRTTL